MRELCSETCSLDYCVWLSTAGLTAATSTIQRDLSGGTCFGTDASVTRTSWSSLNGSSSSVCGGVAGCSRLRHPLRQALGDGQRIWCLEV